jgi:glutathionylspermidine synthase
MSDNPMHAADPLADDVFREIRLRTMFECFKWDPQVEDSSILAPFAVTISNKTWSELSALAEKLAEETLAAEEWILSEPTLLSELKLPRKIAKALRDADSIQKSPRVMRFDFHWTREGWRISEVNSDVPGGFVEAQGYTTLMAQATGLKPTGFPATAVSKALMAASQKEKNRVALVHASAYTDDRQVMLFLARELENLAGHAVLLDPSQIDWQPDGAFARSVWLSGKLDSVFRFFPAEWLPNLRRTCAWENYFTNARTPQCNPGTALLTQTKRFGLLCSTLANMLPTWNRLLPATREIRGVDPRSEEWVFKPALGRVGDGIGIAGVTNEKELRQIRQSMFFSPGDWVAQRRFEITPVETAVGPQHVCFGVYTINGIATGIYGRCAASPIINHTARDVAVLLEEAE